jgi:hypothetical protein
MAASLVPRLKSEIKINDYSTRRSQRQSSGDCYHLRKRFEVVAVSAERFRLGTRCAHVGSITFGQTVWAVKRAAALKEQ